MFRIVLLEYNIKNESISTKIYKSDYLKGFEIYLFCIIFIKIFSENCFQNKSLEILQR